MLKVTGLVRHFRTRNNNSGIVRAVDGVSFTLAGGELLGITGESGCGKSTLARTILRLIEPDRGTVVLDGTEITALSQGRLKNFRPRMQLISQDPESAFNPRYPVGASIAEPFRILDKVSGKKALELSEEYLARAGFDPGLSGRYPFELSGGQLQKAAVARALACRPTLVIADEPTSALDPSAQAQVARLFQQINRDHEISLIWISHDIALLSRVCQRIAVMHAGKIVGYGTPGELLGNPAHPVTKSLPTQSDGAGPDSRPLLMHGEVPAKPVRCAYVTDCRESSARWKSSPLQSPDRREDPATGCHP